jgi:formylglycine-generating enzyme required for sulfatase activity
VEWIELPSGVLQLGDGRLRDAAPRHSIALAGFALGKYPVTNDEYARFVGDRGYEKQEYWTAMGWKWQQGRLAAGQQERVPGFWHEPRLNQPRYPVVGVSWYEAVAFCRWLSERERVDCRLPSEAEWEYAARGPESTRLFPWGDTFERGRANTAEAGLGGTSPVAHYPGGVSPFGVWDMAGNVFEWTLSKWGGNWQELQYPYPYRADDGREDPEGSGARVMRGGSWFNVYQEAACVWRSRYLAGSRASNIGFRVARSVSLSRV